MTLTPGALVGTTVVLLRWTGCTPDAVSRTVPSCAGFWLNSAVTARRSTMRCSPRRSWSPMRASMRWGRTSCDCAVLPPSCSVRFRTVTRGSRRFPPSRRSPRSSRIRTREVAGWMRCWSCWLSGGGGADRRATHRWCSRVQAWCGCGGGEGGLDGRAWRSVTGRSTSGSVWPLVQAAGAAPLGARAGTYVRRPWAMRVRADALPAASQPSRATACRPRLRPPAMPITCAGTDERLRVRERKR